MVRSQSSLYAFYSIVHGLAANFSSFFHRKANRRIQPQGTRELQKDDTGTHGRMASHRAPQHARR